MDGSGLARLVSTDWRSVDLVIASGAPSTLRC
jgi:hypothetical protein